jgi:hypothetical protein
MTAKLELQEFAQILYAHLNSSTATLTKGLVNREVQEIEEALETPGRTIFIFGVRHENKTLANMIAAECPPDRISPDSKENPEAILTVVIRHSGTSIKRQPDVSMVAVEEFDQITDESQRSRFAHFVRAVAERRVPISFVLCGVSPSLKELLSPHESAYDYAAQPPRFARNGKSVIAGVVGTGPESRLPHCVHLISENLFWEMYNDPTFARAVL